MRGVPPLGEVYRREAGRVLIARGRRPLCATGDCVNVFSDMPTEESVYGRVCCCTAYSSGDADRYAASHKETKDRKTI
ncbi:hypothetical protein EVAR_69826_1 [Eumeta japonica]|uniref:Uncharacterized protein n=1 Tax=Eumeta variegata TaxID=151549 RepID=A0A4C2A632_EUMVA|nr:hypothetical protein EVAR_69826_1 [Eumeta japonica]